MCGKTKMFEHDEDDDEEINFEEWIPASKRKGCRTNKQILNQSSKRGWDGISLDGTSTGYLREMEKKKIKVILIFRMKDEHINFSPIALSRK